MSTKEINNDLIISFLGRIRPHLENGDLLQIAETTPLHYNTIRAAFDRTISRKSKNLNLVLIATVAYLKSRKAQQIDDLERLTEIINEVEQYNPKRITLPNAIH
jgi:hypothetical protein